MLDSKIISTNFSRQAAIYNDCAQLQKHAAKKLVELAEDFFSETRHLKLYDNTKILDLGSGTSFIAKKIIAENKNFSGKIFEVDIAANMLKQWQERPSNVFTINADINDFSFENKENFDLVFSSFCLQWIKNYHKLFSKLEKITKHNSLLAFCLPGFGSLAEIIKCNIISGCNFELQSFPETTEIKNSLQNCGFEEIFFSQEKILQPQKSATALLKDLKKIGAGYSSLKTKFVGKKNLQKFNELFFHEHNNHCSWNIDFLIFKKKQLKN